MLEFLSRTINPVCDELSYTIPPVTQFLRVRLFPADEIVNSPIVIAPPRSRFLSDPSTIPYDDLILFYRSPNARTVRRGKVHDNADSRDCVTPRRTARDAVFLDKLSGVTCTHAQLPVTQRVRDKWQRNRINSLFRSLSWRRYFSKRRKDCANVFFFFCGKLYGVFRVKSNGPKL